MRDTRAIKPAIVSATQSGHISPPAQEHRIQDRSIAYLSPLLSYDSGRFRGLIAGSGIGLPSGSVDPEEAD